MDVRYAESHLTALCERFHGEYEEELAEIRGLIAQRGKTLAEIERVALLRKALLSQCKGRCSEL